MENLKKSVKLGRDSENIKKAVKLSRASEDVKSYFDTEAKEESHVKNKMIDDNSEDNDDDEEEEQSNIDDSKSVVSSDDEDSNVEDTNENKPDSSVLRKRKCEFSTLDEGVSKKKEGLSLRWFPNGNKVCIDVYLLL